MRVFNLSVETPLGKKANIDHSFQHTPAQIILQIGGEIR